MARSYTQCLHKIAQRVKDNEQFAIDKKERVALKEKSLSVPLNCTVYKAMFTLYGTVKRSVAESVLDRDSVHTRNSAFKAFSAPEQYCSAPLLKVERSVLDRFLKRPESSLNTFIGAEIATEPRSGK